MAEATPSSSSSFSSSSEDLSPYQLKVGTLNCNTLNHTERKRQLVAKAAQLNLDLVFVQEHNLQWKSEYNQCTLEMDDGWLLMFTPAFQMNGSGVGVLVSPWMRSFVTWRAIHVNKHMNINSEDQGLLKRRAIRFDVKVSGGKVTFFCVHVPHTGLEDPGNRADQFFEFLKFHVMQESNLTIVLGDFNARLVELNFPPFELKWNKNSKQLINFLNATGMESVHEDMQSLLRKLKADAKNNLQDRNNDAQQVTNVLNTIIEQTAHYEKNDRLIQKWIDNIASQALGQQPGEQMQKTAAVLKQRMKNRALQLTFDAADQLMTNPDSPDENLIRDRLREHVEQLVTFIKSNSQLDYILIKRRERHRIIERCTDSFSPTSKGHKLVWCQIQIRAAERKEEDDDEEKEEEEEDEEEEDEEEEDEEDEEKVENINRGLANLHLPASNSN